MARWRSGIPAALTVVLAALPCPAVRLAPSLLFVPGRRPGCGWQNVSFVEGASNTTHLVNFNEVPGLSRFKSQWNTFMGMERFKARLQRQPQKPTNVAVVVGVFSRAGCEDVPFRQAIRSSWMTLPEVCALTPAGPKPHCSLYVTFVVGQGGKADEDSSEPDLTVLPMEENLNCGKTPAWFNFAATQYTWATHIVKMDTDAFPFVHTLLASIHYFPPLCENVFGGRSWVTPAQGGNESERGLPVNNNFLKCGPDKAKGCWSYMQGGLYLLTTELARKVSAPGGWFQEESKKCLPEDLVTGRAVHRYALEKGICVSALRFWKGKEYWHNP
uniref:Hexosyltransferase n=1 Tax=Alexandrium monilatum TaxID=311494 RepID=A0A7S4SRM9_9DINO